MPKEPLSIKIARRVDHWVESTKWLVAFSTAIFSPLVVHAIGLWIRRVAKYPLYASLFALGVGVVVVLCRTSLVSHPWIRLAIEWERRGTQSLLSLLLLYPASRLFGPSDPEHPRSRWLGKGNWVIVSSPYFFPAASILLWMVSWLFLPAPLRSFVLGVGVAYHVASVIIQWRHGSSDWNRLGTEFCVLFLIPANLLVVGAGFAFALDGLSGLLQFLDDLIAPLRWTWQGLLEMVKNSTDAGQS